MYVQGVFQGIIRRKALADMDAWISRAQASLVAPLARGMSKDKAAIDAAIALPWSNGQTEGQICKLELVKRQMYGRGNLALLQARIIGHPETSTGFDCPVGSSAEAGVVVKYHV